MAGAPDFSQFAVKPAPQAEAPDFSAYAQQPASPEQTTGAARAAEFAGSNILKGGLQLLGLPGDALRSGIHLYSQYIGSPVATWLTNSLGEGLRPSPPIGQGTSSTEPQQPVWSGHNPLDSESLISGAQQGLLPAAGLNTPLVDNPHLQPQNEAERIGAAAAQGVGGAIPLMFLGDPAGVLTMLRNAPGTIAAGAGAGVGSYEGGKIGQRFGRVGETIGNVAGGLAGAMAGEAPVAATGKVAGAIGGAGTPLAESYARLGIKRQLAGDVSGNPTLQGLQSFATQSVGGAGRMEHVTKGVVQQFGDAVERIASRLGGSQTAQDAGTFLQTAARFWNDHVFPAIQAHVWAPIDAAVRPTEPVDLTNYRAALQSIAGKTAGMPATGAALRASKAGELLDALQNDLQPGQPTSWETAREIQRRIGDAMGTPEIVNSLGSKQMNQLYGALLQDLRTTAARNGVLKEFDAARKAGTDLFSFRNNVISRFIQSRNPAQETITPDAAAHAALGSNQLMQAVRATMPSAADEIAAYKLRQMTMAKAGKQGEETETVSPSTFLTNLANMRLKMPEGVKALFGGIKQQIDDLAKVSNSMKESAGKLNTSGTARHSALAHIFGGGAGIGAAIVGLEHGGIPGAIGGYLAGHAAPFASTYGLAHAMSNPALTRLLSARNILGAMPLPLSAFGGLAGTGSIPEIQKRRGLPPGQLALPETP